MLHRLLCLLLALTLLGLAPLRGAMAQPVAGAPTEQAMPCHAVAEPAAEAPDTGASVCPFCADGACALCAHCAVQAMGAPVVRTAGAEAGHAPWVSRADRALSDPPARVPQPPPRSPR